MGGNKSRLTGYVFEMKPYISAALYMLAMTATIALWNADIDTAWSWIGLGIWACASFLFGMATGRIGCLLLAFVAIPIAVPFGIPDDDFRWSEPFPLWWSVAAASFFAAGLVAVGAVTRKAIGRRNRPAVGGQGSVAWRRSGRTQPNSAKLKNDKTPP